MIENECKTPYECLTFISIKNIFYDKMELRLFYFDMAGYTLEYMFKMIGNFNISKLGNQNWQSGLLKLVVLSHLPKVWSDK